LDRGADLAKEREEHEVGKLDKETPRARFGGGVSPEDARSFLARPLDKRQVNGGQTHSRRATRSCRRRVGRDVLRFLLVTPHVARRVSEHREQAHAVQLALVTWPCELGILPWLLVHEPAPAGGACVEPSVARSGDRPQRKRAQECGRVEQCGISERWPLTAGR